MTESDRDIIYQAVKLTQFHIDLVESYIESDNDGSFIETETYEILLNHFCDTGEMPYAVMSQDAYHPENTDAPDDWIINYLKGENQ
jgi:hypothetical protein